VSIPTKTVINNRKTLNIHSSILPYISMSENIVFLAAHGSIHQWYRLFWLKDFSVLISKTESNDLQKAFELSKKLKLNRCFFASMYFIRMPI
jgi:hypothetical protein